MPLGPKDSGAVKLEFLDGTDRFGRRITRVTFDSIGTPIHMAVMAPSTISDHEVRMYGIAINFRPVRQGRRMIAVHYLGLPSGGVVVDSVEPQGFVMDDLPEAEIVRAEAKARRFWASRCNELHPDQ